MSTNAIQLSPLKEGDKILICYPYAGGSVSSYMPLMHCLPDDVGLYVFNLHANDYGVIGQTIQSVAEICANYLQKLANRSMAVFGHSMGALLAYESIRDIQHVQHLFISGHTPPHIQLNDLKRYKLDNNDLISLVADLSGTQSTLLASPDFVEMFLPIIRQDFQLCDEYYFIKSNEYQVQCPITVFGGDTDKKMPFEKMLAWQNYTHNKFDNYMFSGGHFFIQSHIKTIVKTMMGKLKW